jgi:hypothetical protein
MKFSEIFEVALTGQEDWFDPVLNVDTEVYIDPFLIYADPTGDFAGAQEELVGYFEQAYRLLAASHGNRRSLQWRLAVGLLAFPEAGEFCLGVSRDSTHGAGSGRGYATQIAEAMWEAIQIGLTAPSHFEEVELFRVGIGPDRISDALGTILKHRFASYTRAICEGHDIPLRRFAYARGFFHPTAGEWLPRDFHLPVNRYNNDAILLAPRRYLRQLPTINSREFFHYCLSEAPELVAARLGFDIQSRVNKEEIVQLARENPELVRAYAASVEASEPDPYDFDRDPKGLYRWYDSTRAFAEANAQVLPRFHNAGEFQAFIRSLSAIFANYVEGHRVGFSPPHLV